jgi:hypothetical protein
MEIAGFGVGDRSRRAGTHVRGFSTEDAENVEKREDTETRRRGWSGALGEFNSKRDPSLRSGS